MCRRPPSSFTLFGDQLEIAFARARQHDQEVQCAVDQFLRVVALRQQQEVAVVVTLLRDEVGDVGHVERGYSAPRTAARFRGRMPRPGATLVRMTSADVAVVGGTVAALASALALQDAGRRLDIVHIGTRPAVDVTVLLWPRGVRVLEQLGVERADTLGQRARMLRYRDARGCVLSEVDLAPTGARLVARSQIAMELSRVCEQRRIRHIAADVVNVVVEGRGFRVDASSGGSFSVRAVVGAAGLKDPVRTALFGRETREESGGIVLGHAPAAPFAGWGNDGIVELVFGPSEFIGILPCLDHAGAQVGSSWWLLVPSGPLSIPPASTLDAAIERVARAFDAPVTKIVEASTVATAMPPRPWIDPMQPAGATRAALVGDSFRAATPELGLGVTWALEDAWRLGRSVQASGLVPGIGAYVRESVATSNESVLGRMFGRGVAREEYDPLRRFALGLAPVTKMAAHVLSSMA